jgi:hypothetical protein
MESGFASLTVGTPAEPVKVIATGLPGGHVATAYSHTLQASGGFKPYTWSIASGSLPAGLSLSPSTGVISGTPTSKGAYDFAVEVKDAEDTPETAEANLSITVLRAFIKPSLAVIPSALSVNTTQKLTVSVTVSGGTGNPTPAGTVTLAGGGYTSAAATLSSGYAKIDIPAGSLNAGDDTLTVTYTPVGASAQIYKSASGSASVTVNKFTATVDLTSNLNPSTYGAKVTFTASVTGSGPSPQGAVTFLDGASTIGEATLSGGVAKFTTESLVAGRIRLPRHLRATRITTRQCRAC